MTVSTYAARRRLEITPGVFREPDELLPEAHTYRIIDSWVHTGYIQKTEVSEAEFRAAVKKFCPDQASRVLELAGVSDAVLEGPHLTPRVLTVTKDDDAEPPAKATKPKATKKGS